ncbi:uncharacterized protein METZ01_LOCUS360039, partial [marine metagenome]
AGRRRAHPRDSHRETGASQRRLGGGQARRVRHVGGAGSVCHQRQSASLDPVPGWKLGLRDPRDGLCDDSDRRRRRGQSGETREPHAATGKLDSLPLWRIGHRRFTDGHDSSRRVSDGHLQRTAHTSRPQGAPGHHSRWPATGHV